MIELAELLGDADDYGTASIEQHHFMLDLLYMSVRMMKDR